MSNVLVVKDKVSRFARELFQDVRLDNDGDLKVPYGSTVVYVRVIDRYTSDEAIAYAEKWNLSKTVVRCYAPVLLEVKGSTELFKWVAVDGNRWFLGNFYLLEVDNGNFELWFGVEIPGDELDQGEFNSALTLTADVANENDEELQSKFGGKRIEDIS